MGAIWAITIFFMIMIIMMMIMVMKMMMMIIIIIRAYVNYVATVLNVLMFVPYPQSIKSLHSNRALQGPGDQNGPK